MTQTTKNPNPSGLSLDSLRERSSKLGRGIAGIRQNIDAIQHRLAQLQGDLHATTGAKDYVDSIIKELETPPAPEVGIDSPKVE